MPTVYSELVVKRVRFEDISECIPAMVLAEHSCGVRQVVCLAERCQSAGGNCQLAFAILPARRAGQIWQTYKRLMAIFGMVWREAPVMRANIRRL